MSSGTAPRPARRPGRRRGLLVPALVAAAGLAVTLVLPHGGLPASWAASAAAAHRCHGRRGGGRARELRDRRRRVRARRRHVAVRRAGAGPRRPERGHHPRHLLPGHCPDDRPRRRRHPRPGPRRVEHPDHHQRGRRARRPVRRRGRRQVAARPGGGPAHRHDDVHRRPRRPHARRPHDVPGRQPRRRPLAGHPRDVRPRHPRPRLRCHLRLPLGAPGDQQGARPGQRGERAAAARRVPGRHRRGAGLVAARGAAGAGDRRPHLRDQGHGGRGLPVVRLPGLRRHPQPGLPRLEPAGSAHLGRPLVRRGEGDLALVADRPDHHLPGRPHRRRLLLLRRGPHREQPGRLGQPGAVPALGRRSVERRRRQPARPLDPHPQPGAGGVRVRVARRRLARPLRPDRGKRPADGGGDVVHGEGRRGSPAAPS